MACVTAYQHGQEDIKSILYICLSVYLSKSHLFCACVRACASSVLSFHYVWVLGSNSGWPVGSAAS